MSFNYMEEIGTPANPDGVNKLFIGPMTIVFFPQKVWTPFLIDWIATIILLSTSGVNHLANLNYASCVRMESGYCGIRWSQYPNDVSACCKWTTSKFLSSFEMNIILSKSLWSAKIFVEQCFISCFRWSALQCLGMQASWHRRPHWTWKVSRTHMTRKRAASTTTSGYQGEVKTEEHTHRGTGL